MPTITPVREARHVARYAIVEAVEALSGKPGMTRDEQLDALDFSITRLNEAAAALSAARDIVATRDIAAHKAEKAAHFDETDPETTL